MTADVKSFPDYEQYKYGEIPVGFRIDLSNPGTVQVLGPDKHQGQVLSQDVLTEVGNRPSTLPDIEAMVNEYYAYTNAARRIAIASSLDPVENYHEEGFRAYVEKWNIDFAKLSNLDGRTGQAVMEAMRYEKPFSSSYLYETEADTRKITDMLTFVEQQPGMDPQVVAMLAGKAAEGALRQIIHVEQDKPNFPHLSAHALRLMEFAKELVTKQPDEMAQINCADQMRDEFNRLHRILSRKMPDLAKLDLPEMAALPSGVGTEGCEGKLGIVPDDKSRAV